MPKIDLAKDFGLAFNYAKAPEWTQECIAERKIVQGVIISDDRSGKTHFIKVLEILPINFSIMTDEEQDSVIARYKKFLKIGPEDIHIKIVTDIANLEEYVMLARSCYEKEPNEACKALIANYINFLQTEGGFDSYVKRYYLIFELSEEEKRKVKTEEDGVNLMLRKAEEVKASLRSTGSGIVIHDADKENRHLAELLYNFYNRRSKEYDPYEMRNARINKDREKVNQLLPNANIKGDFRSLIAPRSIDFCESPSYVVIDGIYKSHYYVQGTSIPDHMATLGGWLDGVSNLGYGYDVDIYFQKANMDQRLSELRFGMKMSRYNLDNTSEDQENAEDIENRFFGHRYFKSALKGGREEIYDMSVLVTVWAYTLEALNERKHELKKASRLLDLDIFECKRFQEEAFYSTGFSMELRPKIYNLTRRNLTTSGVAASYSFTNFSLADKGGIAIGTHAENSSMIMYDQFDERYPNANMFIIGQTGMGKSYTVMTLTSRYRYHGIQNFIISPFKQEEFRRICDAIGGEFIDIAATSNQRINPLEIMPMTSPEEEFLSGDSYTEKSWAIDKIEGLKTWLKYLVPDLTTAEESIIETLLVDLYRDFGITENNDSIYEDEAHTKIKKMPIIEDLHNKVLDEVEKDNLRRDIPDILSRFITGAARSMNGQTNVDLSNKYIVFGVENIRNDMLPQAMFIILQFIWARCRSNRTEKKIIVIDEGQKLFNDQNPEVSKFVMDIYQTVRGFGGGAIFATQSLIQILEKDPSSAAAILTNSRSKILHGMAKNDIDFITGKVGLNSEERALINQFERGQALFCAGTNHMPVNVRASNLEHKLFTTKRADLERMFKESLED